MLRHSSKRSCPSYDGQPWPITSSRRSNYITERLVPPAPTTPSPLPYSSINLVSSPLLGPLGHPYPPSNGTCSPSPHFPPWPTTHTGPPPGLAPPHRVPTPLLRLRGGGLGRRLGLLLLLPPSLLPPFALFPRRVLPLASPSPSVSPSTSASPSLPRHRGGAFVGGVG